MLGKLVEARELIAVALDKLADYTQQAEPSTELARELMASLCELVTCHRLLEVNVERLIDLSKEITELSA